MYSAYLWVCGLSEERVNKFRAAQHQAFANNTQHNTRSNKRINPKTDRLGYRFGLLCENHVLMRLGVCIYG